LCPRASSRWRSSACCRQQACPARTTWRLRSRRDATPRQDAKSVRLSPRAARHGIDVPLSCVAICRVLGRPCPGHLTGTYCAWPLGLVAWKNCATREATVSPLALSVLEVTARPGLECHAGPGDDKAWY